jgi:hypothetical protein
MIELERAPLACWYLNYALVSRLNEKDIIYSESRDTWNLNFFYRNLHRFIISQTFTWE